MFCWGVSIQFKLSNVQCPGAACSRYYSFCLHKYKLFSLLLHNQVTLYSCTGWRQYYAFCLHKLFCLLLAHCAGQAEDMWPLTGAFLAALEVQWRCAGPGHAAVTPVSHLDWWSYEASCSEPADAVCVCNVYNQSVLVNCSSLWGLMMMMMWS